MKQHMLCPLAALIGGVLAAGLRLAQNRTGFEASTGLPVPGNLWGMLLISLLIVLAVLFFLLVRCIPLRVDTPPAPSFAVSFSTTQAGLLTVTVAGVLLVALSGVWEAALGLGVLPGGEDASSAAGRLSLVLGVMSLLSAGSLFSAVVACRRAGAHEADAPAAQPVRGTLLLVPVVFCVIRLVVTYREDSIDPALSVYYIDLLALVFLTLAFYRLSSFAFQAGLTRRFAFFAMAAIVLCAAVLTDPLPLCTRLYFAGCGVSLLGFLLLRLDCLRTKKK